MRTAPHSPAGRLYSQPLGSQPTPSQALLLLLQNAPSWSWRGAWLHHLAIQAAESPLLTPPGLPAAPRAGHLCGAGALAPLFAPVPFKEISVVEIITSPLFQPPINPFQPPPAPCPRHPCCLMSPANRETRCQQQGRDQDKPLPGVAEHVLVHEAGIRTTCPSHPARPPPHYSQAQGLQFLGVILGEDTVSRRSLVKGKLPPRGEKGLPPRRPIPSSAHSLGRPLGD